MTTSFVSSLLAFDFFFFTLELDDVPRDDLADDLADTCLSAAEEEEAGVVLATLFRVVFCCICIDLPPSSPAAVLVVETLLTSWTSGRLDSAAAMGRCGSGGHAAVATVADNTVVVSCVGNTASNGNPSRTS